MTNDYGQYIFRSMTDDATLPHPFTLRFCVTIWYLESVLKSGPRNRAGWAPYDALLTKKAKEARFRFYGDQMPNPRLKTLGLPYGLWWTDDPIVARAAEAFADDEARAALDKAPHPASEPPLRLTFTNDVFVLDSPRVRETLARGAAESPYDPVLTRAASSKQGGAGMTFHGASHRSHPTTGVPYACAACTAKLPIGAWYTLDVRVAERLTTYADEAARAAIGEFQQALTDSRATERADVSLPVPAGLSFYPFQRAGIAYALTHSKVLIGDEMGLGKQHPVDTKILTPSGWRQIGTLKIGDEVIGSNGRATRVTGVFPQGVKPSYRVRFSDHSSVEAGPDHLWTVAHRRGGRVWADLTLTTDQLRLRPMMGRLNLALTTLYLPMLTAPVTFEPSVASERPIPPYTLGQLISNGYMTGNSPVLTTNTLDIDEIMARLRSEGADPGPVRIYGGAARTHVRGIMDDVRGLNLDAPSPEKILPREYLVAPSEDRLALLQGLMDGDGSITPTHNKVTYHTTSPRLADDVQELVECLGGIASIRAYDRTSEGKPLEFQVRIRMPKGLNPFSTTRKASRYQPGRLGFPCRTVIAVEYVRDVESVCIAVEAEDYLYATEHAILTHNTVQAVGVANADDSIRRTLVIGPASLRINWTREARRWLTRPTDVGILGEPRTVTIPVLPDETPSQTAQRAGFPMNPDGTPGQSDTTLVLDAKIVRRPAPAPVRYTKAGKPIAPRKAIPRVAVRFLQIPFGDRDTLVVTNYERVRGKENVRLLAWLQGHAWDMLVVDESHRLKGGDTQQTQAILGTFSKSDTLETPGLAQGPRRLVLLTGTPIPNRPRELWPLLRVVAPGLFGGYGRFSARYCGGHHENVTPYKRVWVDDGATRLDELQDRLRSCCLVRRLKSEVLPELPPKRRQILALEPTPEVLALMEEMADTAEDDEHEAQFDALDDERGSRRYRPREGAQQFRERMVAHRETILRLQAETDLAYARGDTRTFERVAEALTNAMEVAFEGTSKLRQEIAVLKVPQVTEHVIGLLEGGVDKVVVMAYHHEVVEALQQALAPYGAVVHYGKANESQRQHAVDSFQTDPKVRVFVGSIATAGVGITLTASSTMVFAEEDWVPANITQAEDREWRIGQANSVLIQHLVYDGTLEARMVGVLVAKQDIADAALDTRHARRTVLADVPDPNRRIQVSPEEARTAHERAASEARRGVREVLAGATWRGATRPEQYPVATDRERAAAAQAVQTLARVCDLAQTRDDVGFAQCDVFIGHTLANVAGQQPLTDGEVWMARQLARKYWKQLSAQTLTELGIKR